jgi:aminoglycoside 3-N-acetyltransferase I
MNISRLTPGDEARAHELFAMMASVFESEAPVASDEYVRRLLARDDFWAVTAIDADEVIGGITAYVLPMTRAQTNELFIYDVAVRVDKQRMGVGRALIGEIHKLAAASGIDVSFVAAENEDAHAVEFYRAVGGAESAVTFFTFER